MSHNKRSHESEPGVDPDSTHPSRQKRVKYSEEYAHLAAIYNDLADEVQAVRINAASELLKNISQDTLNQDQRLVTAEARLIKGLCSGRKAARLGFSIALAELCRLRFRLNSSGDDPDFTLAPILERIKDLTRTEGNVRGQGKRDHLIGRRFAFQAVLQSDVGLQNALTDVEWSALIHSIFQLAGEKPWLRRECGAFLYEYLVSPKGSELKSSRVQAIVYWAAESKQLKTPEGVGLWIAIKDQFPSVKFPKGVWHHNNPLSSTERLALSKVLLENAVEDETSMKASGARQTSPSFVWMVILSHLYQRDDGKHLEKFWESCVVSPMFTSSASKERKSLGLQVFSLALSSAPVAKLPRLIHPNIVRCIVDERADRARYLFDAAKVPLDHMVARTKQDSKVSDVLLEEMITTEVVNFDQLTKANTVENLIKLADHNSLDMWILQIREMLWQTGNMENQGGSQPKKTRQMLADLLLMTVRLHKEERALLTITFQKKDELEETWLEMALKTLAEFAYSGAWTQACKAIFRSKLMSCLSCLMDPPFEHAFKAPAYVVAQIVKRLRMASEPDDRSKGAIDSAQSCLENLLQHHIGRPSSQAFSMLIAMSILQVYNQETDAVSLLEDLLTYDSAMEGRSENPEMLIEVLLSFVSKPSALFRKLAEQVFAVFAPEIQAESLQSLIDILGQKEGLSGQRELFREQSGPGAEDGEAMDVEDASDVELINGHESDDIENDSQADSEDNDESSSAADEDASNEDDEEAVFDKKLADALGTAGMDDDSDEDGSDMDDEQMMALEPHLTSIFKERQNKPGRKQEKKDAKENIVNFKNRVLNLLIIYIKDQYASVLALDIVLPLATLVRTTGSKPTAEKAFAVLKQYFDTCNKNKSLPQPADTEACFELLASVHEEMRLDGSKLHASVCSRSSLFLSKVLVALDQEHYRRIATMYANLQSEWYADPKSKIHGSIFTEWTSWSITTRKHT